MSDIQCAHCNLDTGGNHEWDCPLHPRNQPLITFTGGSTQYIHIECPDCKIKDDELQLLRSRLTIAEEALKAIRDHEHCDARIAPADDLPPGYRALMTENEIEKLRIGIAAGHRCCATIASEGLKRMEGVK